MIARSHHWTTNFPNYEYFVCLLFYWFFCDTFFLKPGYRWHYWLRAVGRSENPGVPVVIRWAWSVPLVERGLTDPPKSGDAMATLAPPGTTPLLSSKLLKVHIKISKAWRNVSYFGQAAGGHYTGRLRWQNWWSFISHNWHQLGVWRHVML